MSSVSKKLWFDCSFVDGDYETIASDNMVVPVKAALDIGDDDGACSVSHLECLGEHPCNKEYDMIYLKTVRLDTCAIANCRINIIYAGGRTR